MDINESLGRFIESNGSTSMHGAASQLLELLEADEVEPLNQPGASISAEEAAERLETRLERLRRKNDYVRGIDLIEDAVAHLRAYDSSLIAPWTYEDGDGIRWFVLANQNDEEVIACYTSAPFVEAEI